MNKVTVEMLERAFHEASEWDRIIALYALRDGAESLGIEVDIWMAPRGYEADFPSGGEPYTPLGETMTGRLILKNEDYL